jgi:hypothetical protein
MKRKAKMLYFKVNGIEYDISEIESILFPTYPVNCWMIKYIDGTVSAITGTVEYKFVDMEDN